MITVELARALLRDAGVLWEPAAGDRFVIDAELLTGQVFWISDLTVEVQTYRDQSLLGFNGTTEWALDSVTLDQALWLPREDQLRELLGDRLEAVRRTEGGWEVTYAVQPGYVRASPTPTWSAPTPRPSSPSDFSRPRAPEAPWFSAESGALRGFRGLPGPDRASCS